jgi:hypothetical protein
MAIHLCSLCYGNEQLNVFLPRDEYVITVVLLVSVTPQAASTNNLHINP